MRSEVAVNGSAGTYDVQELFQIANTSSNAGLTFSAGDPRLLTATISPSNEVLWRAVNLGLLAGANLTFRTAGGPERMRIDATGNVGIGTTTPTGKLDIWGISSGRSIQTNPNDSGYVLSSFNSSAGNAEQFNIKHNLGAVDIRSERGQLNVIANTASPIVFYTANSTERMRIDSSGNVGIGTTTPGTRLHVLGGTIQIQNTTGAAYAYANTTGGQFYMGIDNSGATAFGQAGAYARVIYSAGAYPLAFYTNDLLRMNIDASGNVSIGQTSTTYKLQVNGSFAANTKSFVIDHPTKPGMKLRYGSLEGPENGVYVRGKIDGTNVIVLPDYWEGLVDLDSITVNLTSIGRSQNPYVSDIDGLKIYIDTENHTQPHCYYHVYAERKDVEKLVVEF